MENLFEQLHQLFKNGKEWNYYNLNNLSNPLISPEYDNSKIFIQDFLEYSNKTKDIYDVLESIEPKRNLHIIIDYFLGIYFYESNSLIKELIDNQIDKYTPSEGSSFDNSFSYFWFLICFYHDVGYCYEQNIIRINSLLTLKNELNLNHDLPSLIGVPDIYQNVNDNYLRYRLEISKVYDHGIIGGRLLYDRLIKVYDYYKDTHGSGKDTFLYKKLVWSNQMLEYFQLIASVIIVHNIWFVNKNSSSDVFVYKKYHLDKLIISDSMREISLEKHPILFLLCLIDSIEPTKQFGINFLKKVKIEFKLNNNIKIKACSMPDNEVDIWFNKIIKLNEWIKLDINSTDRSYIILKF
jgi:hypothetical protein